MTRTAKSERAQLSRQITQIAVNFGGVNRSDALFALCDDGSVWLLTWGIEAGEEKWHRLPGIPQD